MTRLLPLRGERAALQKPFRLPGLSPCELLQSISWGIARQGDLLGWDPFPQQVLAIRKSFENAMISPELD